MSSTNTSVEIDPNDQWDELKTIEHLERIEKGLMEVITHTTSALGTIIGHSPSGEPIVDHPLGGAIAAIKGVLVGCYASYGKALRENPPHDGSEVDD